MLLQRSRTLFLLLLHFAEDTAAAASDPDATRLAELRAKHGRHSRCAQRGTPHALRRVGLPVPLCRSAARDAECQLYECNEWSRKCDE